MEERRRSLRTEMPAELLLKKVDQQTGEKINILIKDVSKDGIGFWSEKELTMGDVYECDLTIWTKEVIHCFLGIVRIEEENGGYAYGTVFVGMTDMDAQRIRIYQTVEEYTK